MKPLRGSDWLGYEPMGGSSKGVALNSLMKLGVVVVVVVVRDEGAWLGSRSGLLYLVVSGLGGKQPAENSC